ncbi:hypothetical protein [Candidatus Paracaedibacter symbiosus]|nr:hypothetical protein [Candidatus Paracaedibacter symbiosus]
MKTFISIVLVLHGSVLLTGCSGINVECCHGLPHSDAPTSRLDRRWNMDN